MAPQACPPRAGRPAPPPPPPPCGCDNEGHPERRRSLMSLEESDSDRTRISPPQCPAGKGCADEYGAAVLSFETGR